MRGMTANSDETGPEARQLRRTQLGIFSSGGFRRTVISRILVRITGKAITSSSDGENLPRGTKPLLWIPGLDRSRRIGRPAGRFTIVPMRHGHRRPHYGPGHHTACIRCRWYS